MLRCGHIITNTLQTSLFPKLIMFSFGFQLVEVLGGLCLPSGLFPQDPPVLRTAFPHSSKKTTRSVNDLLKDFMTLWISLWNRP